MIILAAIIMAWLPFVMAEMAPATTNRPAATMTWARAIHTINYIQLYHIF
jgi:hypothetical protein